MENIKLDRTDRTCEVDFDFAAGRFRLAGESYPEDVAAFFGPLVRSLETYLGRRHDHPIVLDIALVYFNSSSAKALMGMLERFDQAAAAGNDVTVTWLHAGDDEAMQEMGEEFGEDLSHTRFIVRAID
jgi:hypothetical protein